jgi:archaellin
VSKTLILFVALVFVAVVTAVIAVRSYIQGRGSG